MDFKKYIILFALIPTGLTAQLSLTGKVLYEDSSQPIQNVVVIDQNSGTETTTDKQGGFQLSGLKKGAHKIIFYQDNCVWFEKQILLEKDDSIIVNLKKYNRLSEVIILANRKKYFDVRRLKDVEGTAIYAGKKTEVIQIDQFVGNLSSGNARQIYSQIAGLNIYESNNAGLQLAIGGRGLSPNRTANFNTRQNGYDISADAIGYPENYYTPPAEALSEIQIVRGAASLQYGPQFGGLINFITKKPSQKAFEFLTRQSWDTNFGYSTFNSLSGTNNKFSHYTYFRYKNNFGQQPRPNSNLESVNFATDLNYQIAKKTKIGIEYTHLNYLNKLPGGLSDAQFYENSKFSNRSRNWFKVNWNLLALKFNHQFSNRSRFDLKVAGLNAYRNELGIKSYRTTTVDNLNNPRDLVIGKFRNVEAEIRFLSNYYIKKKKSTFLIGAKYYQSNDKAQQGPGSNGNDAHFNFAYSNFPDYQNQSNFKYPNINLALFGEHIFYLYDKLSITPGFRLAYLKTQSQGSYRVINKDLAGKTIQDITYSDNRTFERNFLLLGVGLSYKPTNFLEGYANFSQNYRPVLFNDFRVSNPNFRVDPNIKDEKGYTFDIGIRGTYKKALSYDASFFSLLYNKRIGEVQDVDDQNRVVRLKTNVGKALISGLESLVNWNLLQTLGIDHTQKILSLYSNLALISSKYIQSDIPGVKGNQVEFVPLVNLKTGVKLGYKNLLANIQFTHLSKQFTDASNAPQVKTENTSGVFGAIPTYSVWDLSFSYKYKKVRLETGLNNVLNKKYFTQRATGYPGPGILPANPRSLYISVQFKF